MRFRLQRYTFISCQRNFRYFFAYTFNYANEEALEHVSLFIPNGEILYIVCPLMLRDGYNTGLFLIGV